MIWNLYIWILHLCKEIIDAIPYEIATKKEFVVKN